jgi:hypothetical protein
MVFARSGIVDPGEHLDRETVHQVVYHPAKVVDAVGVRDVGVPALSLTHLLGSTMVVADIENRIFDLLTIELENDSEQTMSTRMLRAEIEKHEVCVFGLGLHAPVPGLEHKRLLFSLFLVIGQSELTHFGCSSWVVLSQGVPLPGRGHQDPF